MIFGRKPQRILPRVDAQSEAVAAIIQGAAILPSKRLTAAIYTALLDNRDISVAELDALANRISRLAWDRGAQMTDEELLLWLRIEDTNLTDLAVDRIEELIEESGRRLALARSEGVARVEQFERNEALTKERDDYAHKLMQANNTYTEMHLEIERLSDKLATCEKYRDAYDEMGRIGTQAVRDLEAKLAKAVEAVDKAAALIEERHVVHMTAKGRNPKDYISEWSLIAKEVRAMLAELKGETHDPL